jgi:hypothetical protein
MYEEDPLVPPLSYDEAYGPDGDDGDSLSPSLSPSGTPTEQDKRADGDSGDNGDTRVRTSWTADELMATEFPEPKWAVPGILAEGINLLASVPKAGKSWMALGLGVAVASGGKALGRIDVEAGPVLALCLEDTPRRIKSRLAKILGPDPAPSTLTISIECPPLPNGGDERIAGWLERNADARLVVVDVLARVRGPVLRDVPSYDADYIAVARAKAVADAYGVAMLVVHHTRKSDAEDFVSTVSGTHGITGAADAIAVLQRMRGRADALLRITGRDIDEAEFALRFAADLGAWQLSETPAALVKFTDSQRLILEYLAGHEGVGPTAIAEGTGLGLNLVKQAVRRMAREGDLDSDGHGRYWVPVTPVTAVTFPGQGTFPAVTALSPPVTDTNEGDPEP